MEVQVFMHKLENIADRIRQKFDVRTAMRDQALAIGAPTYSCLLACHPRSP